MFQAAHGDRAVTIKAHRGPAFTLNNTDDIVELLCTEEDTATVVSKVSAG